MTDRVRPKYLYYVGTIGAEYRYFWCAAQRKWLRSSALRPSMNVSIWRRCRTMRSALRWSSKLLRLGVPGASIQIDRNGPGNFRRWSLSGERECGASV